MIFLQQSLIEIIMVIKGTCHHKCKHSSKWAIFAETSRKHLMAAGGYNYKDEMVHKLWNAVI